MGISEHNEIAPNAPLHQTAPVVEDATAFALPSDEFRIPPPTIASIEFVPLTDSQGILLLVPAAVLAHYKSLGVTTLHFEVPIGKNAPRTGWLTVTQAAREHLQDVAGITLAQATAKISRACDRQRILSSGNGRDRRIEPTSFDAWRLAQRERELDRAEKELS